MYYIENDRLKAGFEAHGAELRSLVDKKTGEEYMWCGDPAFWGRVSPVLFPVVGNYRDKTSIYDGKEYHLSQHGFARDSEFEVVEQKNDSISFRLISNDKTKELYPFDFELTISYKLGKLLDSLFVKWEVKNTDNRKIYFSIGGHPAFNLRNDETYIHFETSEKTRADVSAADSRGTDCNISEGEPAETMNTGNYLVAGILDNGLLSERTKKLELSENGLLKPTVELFAEDALILENCKYNSVALSDSEGRDYLKVSFDAPVLGIWSPAGKNAPFVCIEPWYGRTDRTDFNMKLEEREYGNILEPGDRFESVYTISV